MSQPYLSEVRIFSFNFAPKGWAQCNGQIMSITQNQALFALLGTAYGGNGSTTFGLPNLQGRVPMHAGNGLTQGQTGGESAHTLTISEIPAHNHMAFASSNGPGANTPQNNFWASGPNYSNTLNETMDPTAIAPNPGGQPHNNMAPYTTLNVCIALQGIFPSRN